MNKKKVAIFGGSFNPPINSHLFLAKQVLEKCDNIEKIVFVPVSAKYKKTELVEDIHRYNMLKLMCEDEEKLAVSDIELRQNKQLYTIETLALLQEQYGKNYEIYFVMGTDNLKELDTWKEPEKILKRYKIIVLNRNDDDIKEIIENSNILKKYKNSIIEIKEIKKIDLSSTMIRNKIKNGENINNYVPKKVLEYIEKNGLYK